MLRGIFVQAAEDLRIHLGDATRRALQAVAVGVFADRDEDLAHRLLDAGEIHLLRCFTVRQAHCSPLSVLRTGPLSRPPTPPTAPLGAAAPHVLMAARLRLADARLIPNLLGRPTRPRTASCGTARRR